MRVQIGRYTYRWDAAEPLHVGDYVLIPPTPFCGPTVVRVDATGDGYGAGFDDDELTPITRKLTADETAALGLITPGPVASKEETA